VIGSEESLFSDYFALLCTILALVCVTFSGCMLLFITTWCLVMLLRV